MLAHDYDVRVQSHMCEQVPEIEFTLELFPEYKTTAEIFERAKLMTEKVKKGNTECSETLHLKIQRPSFYKDH